MNERTNECLNGCLNETDWFQRRVYCTGECKRADLSGDTINIYNMFYLSGDANNRLYYLRA